jgi:hypothetical protein
MVQTDYRCLLLVRVRSMSTLHAQVVSKLTASLEGTVRVATIVASLLSLVTVFVRCMTTLHAEVMSELASGLECAIWVALEEVSYVNDASGCKRGTYTAAVAVGATCSRLVMVVSCVTSLSAELLCELGALSEGAIRVAIWVLSVA